MNIQITIALVVLSTNAWIQALDISSLLMDRRYVHKEISCILDRGPCDVLGRHLKSNLPEALNNDCRRCPPTLEKRVTILIEFMQRNYPREWANIVRRYAKYPYKSQV